MSSETSLRQEMALLCKSIYDRGLTNGSTGNISARLDDGSLLVTPTGSSMGFLDPADISHIGTDGQLISGLAPTKEMPLHQAFYDTRKGTGAVVHLHSTYATALSCLPNLDPDDVLPALTPYALMRLGRVKRLPFFMPGDTAMGDAIRQLDGQFKAVLLANHGPVVAGATLRDTLFEMEEFEETAKLVLLTKGLSPLMIWDGHVKMLRRK